MSYHIYTTEGIILKRTPFGEANVVLHILTDDLGLIIASARSARLSVSKLRPALQEYTLVLVSAVKGKNGWKITNVVEKGNFFFQYPKYCHKVLAQISSVLLQMITGESPHPEIFQTVKSGFQTLGVKGAQTPSVGRTLNVGEWKTLGVGVSSLSPSVRMSELEFVSNFETLMVLRILHELGYVVSDESTKVFLKDMNDWNNELLQVVEKNKKNIIGLINKALKESHLTN